MCARPEQYEPSGHASHSDVAWSEARVPREPGGHATGASAPSGQKSPTVHGAQLALDALALSALNDPGGHGEGVTDCAPQ